VVTRIDLVSFRVKAVIPSIMGLSVFQNRRFRGFTDHRLGNRRVAAARWA